MTSMSSSCTIPVSTRSTTSSYARLVEAAVEFGKQDVKVANLALCQFVLMS